MADASRHDAWQAGDSYDLYMGRWSRRVAPRFLEWLDASRDLDWLDVGCGTGALSAAILSQCSPTSVISVDPSQNFVARAQANVPDRRVEFRVGDAQDLPLEPDSRDIAVSALVLNFVPDRRKALFEMSRVTRRGGTVGFYVWDYPGGGLQFVHAFWKAAAALDPSAGEFSEDRRFSFCTEDALKDMAASAGLTSVESAPIVVDTVFADFDDYWRPFTLGAGPAPGYYAKLEPAAQQRFKEALEASLPRESDGSIPLTVKAWAIKARVA